MDESPPSHGGSIDSTLMDTHALFSRLTVSGLLHRACDVCRMQVRTSALNNAMRHVYVRDGAMHGALNHCVFVRSSSSHYIDDPETGSRSSGFFPANDSRLAEKLDDLSRDISF